MTKTINLHHWCADTTAKFREMEKVEMAMYPTPDDRDEAIVQWVLRVLANPDNSGEADVLAAINERRGGA